MSDDERVDVTIGVPAADAGGDPVGEDEEEAQPEAEEE